MKSIINQFTRGLALAFFTLSSFSAMAGNGNRLLEVDITLTNVTNSIILTPPVLAISQQPQTLFTLGQPASEPLAMVAEGGDTSGLQDVFDSLNIRYYNWSGPILPKTAETIRVQMRKSEFLHLASMLLPTNDAFVGLNGFRLRRLLRTEHVGLKAYDAGSEINDESCSNIPGPQCGGEGFSPLAGEGIVYPHAGIHGEGDLSVMTYQWGNPVGLLSAEIVK